MTDILPSLASIIAGSSEIKALIGTNPVRFYPFGAAPPNVAAPYVTERAVDTVPEITLSEIPLADMSRIQLSVWSDNTGTGKEGAKALAKTLRDAIEPHHDVIDIRVFGLDFETQRYRVDLDVQVLNHRDSIESSSSSGP